MVRTVSPRAACVLSLAVALLAGCAEAGEAPVAESGAASAAADAADAGSEPGAEDPAPAPDHEIYYDLTAFDWYRRGEPLLAEGRPHQPGGIPVNLPAAALERAGAYEGVEFYVRTDPDAPRDGAVYVPVFEAYWLPFLPTSARAQAP